MSDLEDVRDAFAALAPLFDGKSEPAALFGDDPRGRLASLELLRSGARLVLATPQALSLALPAPEDFKARGVDFRPQDRFPRQQVVERLEAAGYQRVDFVETPGEYAVRGAVLDFYGLEPEKAVRVLFDEDLVASLRSFDPGTQATLEMLSQARGVCAAETGAGGRLFEWVGPKALWIVEEGAEIDLPAGAEVFSGSAMTVGAAQDLDFGARPNPKVVTGPAGAWAEARRLAALGWKVMLFSLNRGEDKRLQEILEDELPAGSCQFLIGPLQEGFSHPGLKLCLLATSEVFQRNYRPSSRWRWFKASTRGGLRWRELRQGDYVVHQDYGLARYRGLKPVDSPGHGVLDCLKLEFRGSDTLYIPMLEFDKVQKYSGAEGKRPRLSSLDTRKWEEVKHLVKEGVRELADQLLKTQAERAALPGHAFPPETPMEREFAAEFPYEETPDQAKAIADVLSDMTAPHPMDRLIVGDVGFGKTEVAMRAAFKCVAGYKQAAVLVPTTILAEQHHRTFSARFADYPARLAVLTRFQTKAEQAAVVEGLAWGKIDLVIGTSRLLQKDIRFKDLGLIVIDEEHRFGVKDKETFKRMRKSVDCLALSATPIPRTLNQAMSGLRGISLIESAPSGRQPIVTKVGPWSEEAVAVALSEELGRGGQAYYVHNRVRSLGDCLAQLQKLLPQARFGMAHGQMKGPEIEKMMWGFFNRDFDVLVASTIIESGLDIPTVNTLLVEDAHEFGLAQLYQLRGRIGRERQRAYCYFFFPEGREDVSALSEEAQKRLDALREFGSLGAGVKLALRDLEIRGAGDLLGAKQHGFLNAVGVEFYTELLNEEISRRKGKAPAVYEPVSMDIKLPAFIPADYLPGELERLEFYKRILRAKEGEAMSLRRELEDLAGPLPEPVENLFHLLAVRLLAQKVRLRSVTQRGSRVEVYFRPGAPVDEKALSSWMKAYEGRMRFMRPEEGDGLEVELREESPLQWLAEFLASLGSR
jgi:transcription-repair coupling factor (superfamily II helicase)